jgi:hypothetical protein
VPAAIAGAGDTAVRRFLEFFAATIRNKITRTAYYRAVTDFFAWVAAEGAAGIGRRQRGGSGFFVLCPPGAPSPRAIVQHAPLCCPDRMVSTYAFAHLGAPVACVLL